MPSIFNRDDPRLAKIAELWAEGVTTSAIGECLGMPKNSVCGLVHGARQAGDTRFPLRPFKRPEKASPAPQTKRPPRAISEAPVARPRGVPLVETWVDGCRFELGSPEKRGNFQFCNARVEVGVWCAEHWPRIYNSAGSRGASARLISSPSRNGSFT